MSVSTHQCRLDIATHHKQVALCLMLNSWLQQCAYESNDKEKCVLSQS